MGKNSGASAAKKADGLPLGTPFKLGQSGNIAGRPKGIPSLETRVRSILKGETKLTKAIADRNVEKTSTSLQALRGDDKWAKLLLERGYGKVPDKIEGGDPNNPVSTKITFAWEPPSRG